MSGQESLLLVLPVPVNGTATDPLFEEQAINGLHRWAEHFGPITIAAPFMPGDPSWPAGPLAPMLEESDRFRLELLPDGYRPDRFFRHQGLVRRRLRALIEAHTYLSFSIGGLFGDWAALAAIEARKLGRPYSIWTDRVESEVVARDADGKKGWRKPYLKMTAAGMAKLEKHVLSKAALGLLHGADTFEHYRRFPAHAELVHDIHLKKTDNIPSGALEEKLAAASEDRPLRITYVGRAHPMKGGLDWVEALARAKEAGARFEAVWWGDGPQLDELQSLATERGLGENVRFPGFVSERSQIIAALREADVMLFAHKTKESPRNLIESLMQGTPIVGYASPYAEDLIARRQGGRLVPLDDIAGLAECVVDLSKERDTLRELIARAAEDGSHFNDEAVFTHRAEVIKQYLPSAEALRS